MTQTQFRKGDPVTYRPRFLDFDVSARVERVHRDGTVTVQARFVLDDNGEPDERAGFLGYKYRLARESLHGRA